MGREVNVTIIAVVLNALRHQRLWHLAIKESIAFESGAQRLAASEVMASGLEVEKGPPDRVCSTPCGIRGYGIAILLN